MRPRESRTRGPSVAVVPGKTLVILSPAPGPPGPCLPPPAARAPGAEETFPVTAQPHQGGPGAPATVSARSPAPCGEGRVPDCGLGVGVRPPPAGWDDPASSEALQAEWGSLQPPPPSPPLQRPPSPPLGEHGVYSGSPAPLNTRALTAGQAPWRQQPPCPGFPWTSPPAPGHRRRSSPGPEALCAFTSGAPDARPTWPGGTQSRAWVPDAVCGAWGRGACTDRPPELGGAGTPWPPVLPLGLGRPGHRLPRGHLRGLGGHTHFLGSNVLPFTTLKRLCSSLSPQYRSQNFSDTAPQKVA